MISSKAILMIRSLIVFFVTALLLIVMVGSANAEVFIPNNEFRGYFDQYGIYTAVGVVRNLENQTVVPTITINVNDSNHIVSQEFIMAPIEPSMDLPFKIKVPEVNDQNALLDVPNIKFVTTNHISTDIQVVYDKTLVKHSDGHTSGYITNNGTTTGYNVVVYAAIYGKDGKFMDVGQSIENITKIEPNEKTMFSMYPDPTFANNVSYYSCFAFGDDLTKIRYVKKGNDFFNFTYISDAYVRDAKFSNDSNSLILTLNNPWSFSSPYVNFMFPLISNSQHFSVDVNGKPIDFLQSKDPDGKWHVAFDIPKKSSVNVIISGFMAQNVTANSIVRIPQAVKDSASNWADGTTSDSEFVKNIKYLSDNGALRSSIQSSDQDIIPSWFKTTAKWWASGKITDDTFLNSANYLIEKGLLKIKG